MVIDFDKISEEEIMNFKGGEGKLLTRNFIDHENKIMLSRLVPGASSGYHKHEGNSEVVYIISGTATCRYDDKVEIVKAGQVHYCPMGHSHCMINESSEDLVYYAIVGEHKL